jgi:hypothetical protein
MLQPISTLKRDRRSDMYDERERANVTEVSLVAEQFERYRPRTGRVFCKDHKSSDWMELPL